MRKVLMSIFGPTGKTQPASGLCDHSWYVVSTILSEVSLQVLCEKCGLYGDVPGPNEAEWSRAFDSPSQPYEWTQGDRVRTYDKRWQRPF